MTKMKYLRQLLIILIFSFIGEILHSLIPIQVPASIYGLVLLFIALLTGIIQLPQVKEAAKYLIEIMPLMFIPAGVGLLESWGDLKSILIPVLLLLVASTILVMGVSGKVTQGIIQRSKRKESKKQS